jgi:hypothetical protein
VRLYTVRAAEEVASARWPMRADARFVDPYMLPAYRWMAARLAERVPRPRGVKLPLWAWVKKPDLRTLGHLQRGRRGVVLEIELPDSEILLSDYLRFHAVLNRHYLGISKADDDRFDRWAARAPARDQRARVAKSWNRIFSQSPRAKDAAYHGDDVLQAVFWELPRERVVSERAFVAR